MPFDAPGAAILPRYPPVSELATTPLQQSAIAIIFTFNALALVVYLLRMYSRISTKQVGIGRLLFSTTTTIFPGPAANEAIHR